MFPNESSKDGYKAPTSVVIVGSGVFGLSTAWALTQRDTFSKAQITLVDLDASIPSWRDATTASIDTTRIIRADYADDDYSRLAAAAQKLWRSEWGAEGRYSESGLLITARESEGRGSEYVQKSYENVLSQMTEQGGDEGALQLLGSPGAIAIRMNSGNAAAGIGQRGYVNNRSGWADAEASMRYLRHKVENSGRVRICVGSASLIMATLDKGGAIGDSLRRVSGVELGSGEQIHAELTILATGAWTPSLLDLRGRASCRAQCVGYVDVSVEEAQVLSNMPVLLDLSSGHYVFPPKDGKLKIARHAIGYSNPIEVQFPSQAGASDAVKVSLPDQSNRIPREDDESLIDFAKTCLPVLTRRETPLQRCSKTRLCHYLDTASSDFLVCYPPDFGGSLFLATGGSGHGFKFLPLLGERIVDVLDRTDLRSKESGGSDGRWTQRWAWPTRGTEDEVWCDDGSRSGERGKLLADALVDAS